MPQYMCRVGGHFAGVRSLLLPYRTWDGTQVIRLESRCLFHGRLVSLSQSSLAFAHCLIPKPTFLELAAAEPNSWYLYSYQFLLLISFSTVLLCSPGCPQALGLPQSPPGRGLMWFTALPASLLHNFSVVAARMSWSWAKGQRAVIECLPSVRGALGSKLQHR